jgi:hypothetical protein
LLSRSRDPNIFKYPDESGSHDPPLKNLDVTEIDGARILWRRIDTNGHSAGIAE